MNANGSYVSLRMICAYMTMRGLSLEQARSARLPLHNSEGWELALTYASFPVPWWDDAELCSTHLVDCWIVPQLPPVVICSLMYPLSALLPSLSYFLTPSLCFLGSPHLELHEWSKVRSSIAPFIKPALISSEELNPSPQCFFFSLFISFYTCPLLSQR